MRRVAGLPRALYGSARRLRLRAAGAAARTYAPVRVRIAFHGFWPGFSLDSFITTHPYLRLKYEVVECRRRPHVRFVSVFLPGGGRCRDASRIAIPADGRPTVFYTGERVSPHGGRFDWSISHDESSADRRNLYLPGWVRRLNRLGVTPYGLLRRDGGALRPPGERAACAYVFRNRVALREAFFDRLAPRMEIVSPGRSRNNHPAIGPSMGDKLAFLRHFRFNIAFENEQFPRYLTEKISDAFAAGCVPVYCGDPLVERTFAPDAFIHVWGEPDFDRAIARIVALERDPSMLESMHRAAPLVDNRVPDYATHDYAMAFFERIFDDSVRQ